MPAGEMVWLADEPDRPQGDSVADDDGDASEDFDEEDFGNSEDDVEDQES
jgi:hypothetical protein